MNAKLVIQLFGEKAVRRLFFYHSEVRDLITDYHAMARDNRTAAEEFEKKASEAGWSNPNPSEPTSAQQLIMGAVYLETRAQELFESLPEKYKKLK